MIFMNLVADAMVRRPVTHGPESTLEDIRRFFEDDHVHMALVVAADGRLVTTVERHDLSAVSSGSQPAATLGTLAGRTITPSGGLEAVTAALLRRGSRRLAVIDESGRLVGLLCLKRSGTGYCSSEDIRERATRSTRDRC